MVHTTQKADRLPDRANAVGETKTTVPTTNQWQLTPVTTPSWVLTLHLHTLMILKNRPSSQILLDLMQCHKVSGSLKG